MIASDGVQSGVNSLLPKLQTRLVVLPGAINTHQLHRHYTSQNATANRLLQRLTFPEQLTARYTAGVLPTKAIQGRYQRYQRTESLAGGESLINISVVQRSTGNDSGWQQAEQMRTPAGEESTSTQYLKSVTSPSPKLPGKYHISRRPNLTFNSPPGSISVTTSESAPVNSDNLTSSNETANANSTDAVMPNSTAASSIQLKMPPQADNHPQSEVLNLTHVPGSIQRKYGNPEGLQSASESTPSVLYNISVTTDAGNVDSTTTTSESAPVNSDNLTSSNETANANSTDAVMPNSTAASSIQLKMPPQADNHPQSEVLNLTHVPGSIQRKYGNPEGLQSASESTPSVLYRVAHKRVENSTPTAPSPSTGAEELGSSANYTSDSNLGLSSPVTTAQASLVDGDTVVNKTQDTGVNTQRKYHQSDLMWHSGSDAVSDVSKLGTVTATPVNNPTVNSMTSQTEVALQRKYQQSELLWHPSNDTTEVLARSGENNVYDNTKSISINTLANVTPARETQTAGSKTAIAALVQTKPLPLIIPREQRSRENSPIPNQSNLPLFTAQAGINTELPLAISPNNNRGVISRQITTPPVESVTSETINAIPTPTAPTSPSPLNTGVDVAEIAEQVSRIILRRLVVERERRGMGR